MCLVVTVDVIYDHITHTNSNSDPLIVAFLATVIFTSVTNAFIFLWVVFTLHMMQSLMSLCFYLLSSIQQRGRDTQPRSCSFLTIHPIRGVSDLSMVNNPTKTILNWPNLWTNQLLQPQKIILQGPDLIQGSHLGPLWPAELFLIQL
jgi:hypothetical protein